MDSTLPLISSEPGGAEAHSLLDMVSYQTGSVVSRTLVSRKTGTVTLFAFDKDQGLSEHTAPYDALVQVLEGEVRVTIAGRSIHLRQGEFVIMPDGKAHALHALTKFKMLLTMIHS